MNEIQPIAVKPKQGGYTIIELGIALTIIAVLIVAGLTGVTTVLNNSFEHVFADYNSEANFMFLDPPYDSEFTDYGYCQFGKKEHEQLAK